MDESSPAVIDLAAQLARLRAMEEKPRCMSSLTEFELVQWSTFIDRIIQQAPPIGDLFKTS